MGAAALRGRGCSCYPPKTRTTENNPFPFSQQRKTNLRIINEAAEAKQVISIVLQSEVDNDKNVC